MELRRSRSCFFGDLFSFHFISFFFELHQVFLQSIINKIHPFCFAQIWKIFSDITMKLVFFKMNKKGEKYIAICLIDSLWNGLFWCWVEIAYNFFSITLPKIRPTVCQLSGASTWFQVYCPRLHVAHRNTRVNGANFIANCHITP